MRMSLAGIAIGVAIGAAGCRAPAVLGPTHVANLGDAPAIVRLEGTTGTADLGAPPHSIVNIVPPASIGTVRVLWLTYEDCRFKGGGHVYDDGTQGRMPFEAGGLFTLDGMSFSHSDGGSPGGDVQVLEAVPATGCTAVPNPSWSSMPTSPGTSSP